MAGHGIGEPDGRGEHASPVGDFVLAKLLDLGRLAGAQDFTPAFFLIRFLGSSP